MLAVAFALNDTLLAPETDVDPVAAGFAEAFGGDVARSLEAQQLRPAPGALRIVRELEALGVPLYALSDESETEARRKAGLVWFAGDVVTAKHDEDGDPTPEAFAVLAERTGLPAECIWYLSGHSERAARIAQACGMHAVYVDPEARDIAQPEDGGIARVPRIDDALELLRAPYTRSALNLRYIMRTVLQFS